ncbi:unnamed protein product [Rangifer tarandus platyrhynchus]|uniref:Uncharacterized protein n=1 Tax=Rangifer tarandus platyrhynchus TaxID=3082113 RepID=A0ABN9A9A3_RANTA|nr:unnamed protein product [Rangifer tarandus platyrhynchus]
MVNCEECIHDFNRHHTKKPKEGTFTRAKRTSPNNGQKQISRSTNRSFSKAAAKALMVGKEHEAKSSLLFTTRQKFHKSPACGLATYKNLDVARSGNSIPVPKSPKESVTVLDGFHDESPKMPDPVKQGPEDPATPEHETPADVSYDRECSKRKFVKDRRDQPFAKRLHFSVRQRESAYRYWDIMVQKQDGFTHILLSTKLSENNSLNLEVMKELQSALSMADTDDSKLVLLSAMGSIFCCGLDMLYFRRRESTRMAEAIRNFVNTFIQFKKPIIIAVNHPGIERGASILALRDVVWANEKACCFQTPYSTFGQSLGGCSTIMFPKFMGGVSAKEMLLRGWKLTAQETCNKGLVSQVFWPGTFS